MYVAASDDLVTIQGASERYGISRAHLMKVANRLTASGYLEAVRGRNGGLRIGRPASEINLGAVIRVTEPDFALVECFDPKGECILTNRCKLPSLLNEALANFVATFDKYTLEDLQLSESDFVKIERQQQSQRGPFINGYA